MELLLAAQTASALPDAEYGWALLKMVLALFIVCALAYVALRFGTRWLSPQNRARHIAVIDRCPITSHRSLLVVQVGRPLRASQYFLLSSSEGGINLISQLSPEIAAGFAMVDGTDTAAEAGSPQGKRTTFKKLLKSRQSADQGPEDRNLG